MVHPCVDRLPTFQAQSYKVMFDEQRCPRWILWRPKFGQEHSLPSQLEQATGEHLRPGAIGHSEGAGQCQEHLEISPSNLLPLRGLLPKTCSTRCDDVEGRTGGRQVLLGAKDVGASNALHVSLCPFKQAELI